MLPVPFVFRFHRNEGNQESRIRVCFVGSVGRCRTTGSKLWRSMFFDVSLICCRSIYAGIPSKKYTGTLFTIYASFVNCEYSISDLSTIGQIDKSYIMYDNGLYSLFKTENILLKLSQPRFSSMQFKENDENIYIFFLGSCRI